MLLLKKEHISQVYLNNNNILSIMNYELIDISSYLFTSKCNRPLISNIELRILILRGEDVKGKMENPWIKSVLLRYSPNLSGSCSSLKWLVNRM